MKRLLAAASAALVLCCAGAANAATTYDYEAFAPGTTLPWTDFEGGFFNGGVVTQIASGNALRLHEMPDYGTELSIFYIFGDGRFMEGPRQYIWNPELISFELFLPNGGRVNYAETPGTEMTIAPGVWTTITFPNWPAPNNDCRYTCKFFIRGGGAMIDNLILQPGFAAIPEPATWGMMIVGFGLAGSTLRSSRKRRSRQGQEALLTAA